MFALHVAAENLRQKSELLDPKSELTFGFRVSGLSLIWDFVRVVRRSQSHVQQGSYEASKGICTGD